MVIESKMFATALYRSLVSRKVPLAIVDCTFLFCKVSQFSLQCNLLCILGMFLQTDMKFSLEW